jgi:hypothetical protein
MTEETTLAILNQYPTDKYNVLAPQTMTQTTPWHQITVSQVKLDPVVSRGDVYPQSGRLAPSKIGLLKLADAAGVRFQLPTFQRNPEDGSYEAYIVAEKQDPDGTWRQYPGSYYWDVTQRLSEIKDPNSDKGRSEARMIKTFSMQRAETGAMNRAIRNIIGVQATYTAADLAKPFIVARVSFNPFNDPVIRDAYRQALVVKLTENVALMRGDFDPNDPLGMDGPHKSTRPTRQQLRAADDTLALMNGGVDAETGEILDTPEPSGPTWTPDLAPEDEPDPEQAPPPTTNGKAARPYTADLVRGYIRKVSGVWAKGKAGDWSDAKRNDEAMQPPQPEDVQRLAAVMSKAAAVVGDPLERRHTILFYVTGRTSTSELSAQEVNTWLALWEAEPGAWECNKFAKTEAAVCYAARLEEQGQKVLL